MKLNKPYIYFAITALIIYLIGLFFKGFEENIDFNIHDTYFVIAKSHLATLIAIFLFGIGLLYFMFHRLKINLIKRLTSIHTFGTIGCLGFSFLDFLLNRNDNDFDLFDTTPNYIFLIITSILVLVQILFIYNLMVSTYKHIFKKL